MVRRSALEARAIAERNREIFIESLRDARRTTFLQPGGEFEGRGITVIYGYDWHDAMYNAKRYLFALPGGIMERLDVCVFQAVRRTGRRDVYDLESLNMEHSRVEAEAASQVWRTVSEGVVSGLSLPKDSSLVSEMAKYISRDAGFVAHFTKARAGGRDAWRATGSPVSIKSRWGIVMHGGVVLGEYAGFSKPQRKELIVFAPGNEEMVAETHDRIREALRRDGLKVA